MKPLFILSYSFPFNNSEPFLKDELQYLLKYFNKIYILPVRSIWHKFNLDKELHENIIIIQPIFDIKIFFQSVTLLFRIRKLANSSIPPGLPWYISKFLLWRTITKSAIIIAVLKNQKPSFPNALYYSYWKNEAATALAFLKINKEINNFITRCHGGDLYDEQAKYVYRPFDQLVNITAKFIIPISDDGCLYLKKIGFDSEKIITQRLGINNQQIRTKPSTDNILRIVSCSSLIPLKRIPILLESLLLLKIPFRWTHFGDGSQYQILKRIVAEKEMENIISLPGYTPREEIFKYYKNNPVDIFINLSISEGIPVSIMEAFSFGIPCLATNVGGVAELVNNKNGILIDKKIDKHIISSILNNFHNDYNNKQSMRDEAYSTWKTKFNADINYLAFAKLISNKLNFIVL